MQARFSGILIEEAKELQQPKLVVNMEESLHQYVPQNNNNIMHLCMSLETQGAKQLVCCDWY